MRKSSENKSLRRGLRIHLGSANPLFAAKLRAATPDGTSVILLHPASEESPAVDGVAALEVEPLENVFEVVGEILESLGLDDGKSVWLDASAPFDDPAGRALLERIRARALERMSAIRCERAGAPLFVRAALRNLGRAKEAGSWRPRPGIAGLLKGRKAVICGAGPSLERLLPDLRELQDSAFVMAVGRAAPLMLREGVKPDLVCEIDVMAHVNWRGDSSLGEIPLLAPMIASPDVARLFKNVLFSSAPGLPETLARKSGLELPHAALDRSVGVYALDAALKLLSFESVGLLGFDLCFGPDGASHAGAAPSPFAEIERAGRRAIAGREGGRVIANSLFDGMRGAFERECAESPGRVVNCSEGGAAIAGTRVESLRDFLSGASPFPFKGRIEALVERNQASSPSTPAAFAVELEAFARRHAASLAQESPQDFDTALFAKNLLAELEADASSNFEDFVPEAHCVFTRSLRRMALDFVAKSHSEFAAALESGVFAGRAAARWRVLPNFLRPPALELLRAEGAPIPLTARVAVDAVASGEVEAFLKESSFDPARDAALFVCPGNWTHPLELSRRHPESRILILEPWPELFDELISRCQFVHRLSPGTLIVGASDALPGWREVWRRRVRRLMADGLALKIFKNSVVSNEPEIAALSEELSASPAR